MGQVDRIPSIQPVVLQTQPTAGVQPRKEGTKQNPQDAPRDSVELHEEELEVSSEGNPPTVLEEVETLHGLDLSA